MRLAALIVLAAGSATADPIAIPDQPATLDVDAAWSPARTPSVADGPVLVMKKDGGLLAVTVADAANPDAWRDSRREAYEKAIVDGFRATPGVKVLSSTASLVKGVPTLDLALDRGGPVAVRLLLFRTRTVAIAVADSDGAFAALTAEGLAPTHEATPDR